MTADRTGTIKANQIVAVASPSFSQSTILVDELKRLGVKVVINDNSSQFDDSSLVHFLADAKATIAVIGKEKINTRVLSKLPHLQAIAKYGVGVDNIDFAALEERQIKFGLTAGVNRLEVAEMVLGFAIGHFRRLFNASSEMQRGIWRKDGGRDLNALKVGIIGLGNVGSAVAGAMKPFGPDISYFDIADKSTTAEQLGITFKSFDDLIRTSDLITLHVPLTEKTRQMISAATLSRMKSDALIINTARGEVVDFAQTVEAVQRKKLGGYAADVFDNEPVDLSYLGGQENLYFTPHIAANSIGAVLKMGRSAISWVSVFLETS